MIILKCKIVCKGGELVAEKIVKIGVAGLIRGKGIAEQILSLGNVRLCAICDSDAARLCEVERWLTNEKNAPKLFCTTSFDELIASDIDAVFIATHVDAHTECAIKALRAGKHVLSEIPAVTSLEEARALKAEVLSHPNLKYMSAENCCYWAFVQGWKRMYEEGKFGDIVLAQGEYLHGKYYSNDIECNLASDHWRLTLPAIQYITHTLGPLLYIMNDRCVSVTCLEPEMVHFSKRSAPSNGIALFETEKGAAIRISICFGAFVGFDHNYSMYGTKGMIETDNTKSFFDAHSFARFADVPDSCGDKIDIPVTLKFPGSVLDGHGGADARMIADFADCIIKGTKPPLDIDWALRMALPGIYAHMSALSGGNKIEIPAILQEF